MLTGSRKSRHLGISGPLHCPEPRLLTHPTPAWNASSLYLSLLLYPGATPKMSWTCARFAEPRTPRDHLVLQPMALQCVSFSAGRDLRQSLPPHFTKKYTNSSSDLHLAPRAEASQPPSRATQSCGEPAFGVEKLRCVSRGWPGYAVSYSKHSISMIAPDFSFRIV